MTSSRLSLLMSGPGVLQGYPRILVSRQVIRLSLLLGNTVGMRGRVVQSGSCYNEWTC
jgi:hypothetical protein